MNNRRQHSAETKEKLSKAGKGRKWTKEQREKITRALTGRRRSKQEREAISRGHIGIRHTPEVLKAMGQKVSATMKAGFASGRLTPNNNGRRGKSEWYTSPTAGKVYLRSSYESVVARWLDHNKIPWKYNSVRVKYLDANGIPHTYVVDFHRLDNDSCIECKGYDPKWKLKLPAFYAAFPNKRLTVITRDNISQYAVT